MEQYDNNTLYEEFSVWNFISKTNSQSSIRLQAIKFNKSQLQTETRHSSLENRISFTFPLTLSDVLCVAESATFITCTTRNHLISCPPRPPQPSSAHFPCMSHSNSSFLCKYGRKLHYEQRQTAHVAQLASMVTLLLSYIIIMYHQSRADIDIISCKLLAIIHQKPERLFMAGQTSWVRRKLSLQLLNVN